MVHIRYVLKKVLFRTRVVHVLITALFRATVVHIRYVLKKGPFQDQGCSRTDNGPFQGHRGSHTVCVKKGPFQDQSCSRSDNGTFQGHRCFTVRKSRQRPFSGPPWVHRQYAPRRIQRSIWRLKMRCRTFSQVITGQPLRMPDGVTRTTSASRRTGSAIVRP